MLLSAEERIDLIVKSFDKIKLLFEIYFNEEAARHIVCKKSTF